MFQPERLLDAKVQSWICLACSKLSKRQNVGTFKSLRQDIWPRSYRMNRSCCLVTKSCLPLLWPQKESVACHAPLPMGFPRQKYWSRLQFPSPGDLPDPEVEPTSPALAGRFFTTGATWGTHLYIRFLHTPFLKEKERITLKCESHSSVRHPLFPVLRPIRQILLYSVRSSHQRWAQLDLSQKISPLKRREWEKCCNLTVLILSEGFGFVRLYFPFVLAPLG